MSRRLTHRTADVRRCRVQICGSARRGCQRILPRSHSYQPQLPRHSHVPPAEANAIWCVSSCTFSFVFQSHSTISQPTSASPGSRCRSSSSDAGRTAARAGVTGSLTTRTRSTGRLNSRQSRGWYIFLSGTAAPTLYHRYDHGIQTFDTADVGAIPQVVRSLVEMCVGRRTPTASPRSCWGRPSRSSSSRAKSLSSSPRSLFPLPCLSSTGLTTKGAGVFPGGAVVRLEPTGSGRSPRGDQPERPEPQGKPRIFSSSGRRLQSPCLSPKRWLMACALQHIFDAVKNSVKRLQVEYIDLLQCMRLARPVLLTTLRLDLWYHEQATASTMTRLLKRR